MHRIHDCVGIILCGGRAERMEQFASLIPKPMVQFRGRPFVAYIIDQLRSAGVKRIFIVRPEGDRSFENYFDDPDIGFLDAAGSIPESIMGLKLSEGRCLVCYGDTIADIDIPNLMDRHYRNGAGVTITTAFYRSEFGLVEIVDSSEGMVRSFSEKALTPLRINIGYMLVENDFLRFFNSPNLADCMNRIAEFQRAFCFNARSYYTFNTPHDAVRLQDDSDFKRLLEAVENGG